MKRICTSCRKSFECTGSCGETALIEGKDFCFCPECFYERILKEMKENYGKIAFFEYRDKCDALSEEVIEMVKRGKEKFNLFRKLTKMVK